MKPGLLALGGTLIVLASFAADVLLLRFPFIRNGYWTYVPLAAGLALAIVSVAKRRAWTTIVPGVVALLLVGFYTMTRFLSAPTSPPAVGVGQTFPDVTLQDHEGRSVRIAAEAQPGPLVVVLFRGSW